MSVKSPTHRYRQDPDLPDLDCCVHVYTTTDGRGCGLKRSRHRRPDPNRPRGRKKKPSEQPYVSFDVEGEEVNGRHVAVEVNCVDEFGHVLLTHRNPHGLGTKEVLDALFTLPTTVTRLFGFALGYDRTVILKDLPNKALYLLLRPDLRTVKGKRHRRSWPVAFGDYDINFAGTAMLVRDVLVRDKHGRAVKTGRSLTIWDTFKYYQTSFIKACRNWGVGDAATLDFLEDMKAKRSEFAHLSLEEKQRYARIEGGYIASLQRFLSDAIDEAGLTTRRWDGPGAIAAALMKRWGVMKYRKDWCTELGDGFRHAVLSAYGGGRTEASYVGPYRKPVTNVDISSAYPYEIAGLPCLKCGEWKLVEGARAVARALKTCTTALVYARVERPVNKLGRVWGPFQYRRPGGSICYPLSCSVWVWKPEFVEASKHWPNVRPIKTWVYVTKCKHRPFENVPSVYLQRLEWGKEGRGVVLKLGTNSLYGKMAQSTGSAPYNDWVWAGLVTSGTRARALEVLGAVENPWDVLMIATDGLFMKCPLPADRMPPPRDTGTGAFVDSRGKRHDKPLGGWEVKTYAPGIFIARSGIYFSFAAPGEEQQRVSRSRGMAASAFTAQQDAIVKHWEEHGHHGKFEVKGLKRFVGASLGVRKLHDGSYVRSEDYGQFLEVTVKLSLEPRPKRTGVARDGHSLLPHKGHPTKACYSRPYSKGRQSHDGVAAEAFRKMLEEQYEVDYTL